MRQHAAGENKRRRWLSPMDISTGIKDLADEWEKKLGKIPWASAEERIKAFSWGKGPWHWKLLLISEHRTLATHLREEEQLIKGKLHCRQRRDMQISMNKTTAARENLDSRDDSLGSSGRSVELI